jgi:hypothetical protein
MQIPLFLCNLIQVYFSQSRHKWDVNSENERLILWWHNFDKHQDDVGDKYKVYV